MELNQLTGKIIESAIKAHRALGPGFLESVYQVALAYELRKTGIPFEKEKELPVPYGEITLDVGFRADFLVDKLVIVECKAVKELTPLDQAQLLNYLKNTRVQVGLLINFNVLVLKQGIKRMVNQFAE